MAGNLSRGLIAASKTIGWDPTVIPAGNGHPAQNLSDFDKDQGNFPTYPLGTLPGGPQVSWPAPEALEQRVPFNVPDASRENANRRTTNADPYPGK